MVLICTYCYRRKGDNICQKITLNTKSPFSYSNKSMHAKEKTSQTSISDTFLCLTPGSGCPWVDHVPIGMARAARGWTTSL